MSLRPGDRIGSYEILALIGKGGMGEVYRAKDTKLDREVAIKVLPTAFSQDPERLARFEREAKVLASLNHSNIASIYGVAESENVQALVMELVEGQSPKGPLPFDDAWKIALQIIAALEYAHEKGIVHRDLKPANILITPEGPAQDRTVKLLDFGLAKAFAGQSRDSHAAGADDPENSPTLTIGATEAGVVLGTAAYMSPEQARGKQVDKRADIWSFGVVLYELLTGERLFKGEDASETLAQVLTKEPVLVKVPPKARKLLSRCLEKDPKKRLRDIGEAAYLIDEAPVAAITASPVGPRVGVKALIPAALLAVVAAVALAGWWRSVRPVEQPLKPLVRLDVDLGPDVVLGAPVGANVILSPDGTRIAYVSKDRLFTRRLDQPRATELMGTEGALVPFFSPDGQWIGFFTPGNLKKISVEGGSAITLCSTTLLAGASWGEDGNIIASLSATGGLSRIPSAGGTPTPATELAPGEGSQRWPQVLPGSKAVLYTSVSGGGRDAGNIEVTTFADHRRTTLVRGGTNGRYMAASNGAGHLAYINNGTLFAVPFDLESLTVRGTPSPVLEDVAYTLGNGSAQFDFSRSGTLVYRTGGAAGSKLLTVQWLDGAGKTQPLLAKPGPYVTPRLSPDGQRLALNVLAGSSSDIWIYEWQRDTMTRLTFGGGANPAWSPDGRYIVFEAPGGMQIIRSDGAGQAQPLTQSKSRRVPFSFAPDAKRLAFFEFVSGGADVWTVPLESDGSGLHAGKAEPFLQTQFNERHPAFSPDGRWLAYDSNESGSLQVYVRAFPDKGGKWQISNGNGLYPEWSRSGRELFFRTDDNHIMAATYSVNGDSFVADKPRVWSEKTIANAGPAGTNYDVARDGKRIAALFPAESAESRQSDNHVILLENFFDELRRRVPAAK